jgi:hypothetical protein
MADTTTTLNAGSGGDVMDESLVTQADGTEAKRPRVVPGSDDGDLQSFQVGPAGTAAWSHDPEVVTLMTGLIEEQKTTNALLQMVLMQLSGEIPSPGALEELKNR